MSYRDELPQGVTLQVFNGDVLIFESRGKWLHPLFELEDFLRSYSGARDDLRSHDSAIGKAAAVLTVRLGVRKIHAELLSENARRYLDGFADEVQVSFVNSVPKLLCATENQLEDLSDSDEMYFLLRQRARLVQGVDVSVRHLSHVYGCLDDFSFELKAGGHLMVCGENGTGKSTLLKCICGIERPVAGEVLIDGKRLSQLEKFTVGYVPQFADNEGFSLSVQEVVSLGMKGMSRDVVMAALRRTCSEGLAERGFNSLSGGEKQKVQLSRCLAQNARLLLLDEPTASLDQENKRMVMDILRSLTVSEIPTIIVVTHDADLMKMGGWEKVYLGECDGDVGKVCE